MQKLALRMSILSAQNGKLLLQYVKKDITTFVRILIFKILAQKSQGRKILTYKRIARIGREFLI